MTDALERWNTWLNGYVWGLPMIVLLVGTGIVLTILTGGIQFRRLGTVFIEVLGRHGRRGDGTVTPFQAVATALASTVGTGNIVGVATAVVLGGPGALLWLWVSGLFGMCTKFAEIVIALHYRERDASGIFRGGAMYILRTGLGLPWLGGLFRATHGGCGAWDRKLWSKPTPWQTASTLAWASHRRSLVSRWRR